MGTMNQNFCITSFYVLQSKLLFFIKSLTMCTKMKKLTVVFGVFLFLFATSCTQRSCPTYSKQPVEKSAEQPEDIKS